ncbi:hypothetical protein MNBD_GAMMA12-3874 [hydrothermal vent metagenome]|uniref:Uncharacterized protein n=1 Tax=hydrothermal vent metagenome TaxID=652676 RepID=A0A3B0YR96_9ZZZZ
MKTQEYSLAFLMIASLLLALLFPVHLHIHNHFHTDTNQYVSSEIEFIHFEKNSSDHGHAVISNISDKVVFQNSKPDTLTVLFILFSLLFSLALSMRRLGYIAVMLHSKLPHLRPLLRAPPA